MNMKPIIRGYASPDVPDFDTWYPADPDSFSFLLQVTVGFEGQEFVEVFYFTVCTPEWLKRQHGEDAVIPMVHRLLVFEYDFERIENTLEYLIARIRGKSAAEIVRKIGRYGKWESEDF